MAAMSAVPTLFTNVSTSSHVSLTAASRIGPVSNCFGQLSGSRSENRADETSHVEFVTKIHTYTRTITSDVFWAASSSLLCGCEPRGIGETTSTRRVDTIVVSKTVAAPVTSYATPPPCAVSSTASLLSNSCTEPAVFASNARLFYWPVPSLNDYQDFCFKSQPSIAALPTGSGPNTFVVDDVTITSPTAAISIGGLTRYDGCGPTITSTIIPVRPEAISSVRGVGARPTQLPFDFADLNYVCFPTATDEGPVPSNFTPSRRPECYQAVSANAYFLRYRRRPVSQDLPGWVAQDTIWQGYSPQIVLPPIVTDALQSAFGHDAFIFGDPVWEPPQALQSFSIVGDGFVTNSCSPNDGPAAVRSQGSVEGVHMPAWETSQSRTIGAVQQQTTIDGALRPAFPTPPTSAPTAGAVQQQTTIEGIATFVTGTPSRPDISSVAAVRTQASVDGVPWPAWDSSRGRVSTVYLGGAQTMVSPKTVEGLTRPVWDTLVGSSAESVQTRTTVYADPKPAWVSSVTLQEGVTRPTWYRSTIIAPLSIVSQSLASAYPSPQPPPTTGTLQRGFASTIVENSGNSATSSASGSSRKSSINLPSSTSILIPLISMAGLTRPDLLFSGIIIAWGVAMIAVL